MKILTWQARNNKKVTLVKLSKMTGISKSTLNNIENEKVSPTIAELEAIAKALNMKITDLFDSDYK
ncbi:helix-turn-helix domain-containing protein [Lachnospira eligens]|jgi:transcriptional regulator with XRE-family HTH domain|uniref:helix-turn-helix domain-containing protein n=1 Tax=Lachnospira eligens TaxID=39485 RepID=UPI000E4C3443|nr:helix-turn-helix transcriptional regulator [Lachnospira eligens]RHK55815.1 XRE family transcriptional regulator [Lachnospira eligens]RHK84386.1 XRE family transcriptional regulator [Lachnospira eligens]UWI22761.1 MAG: helix-turn-helix domain protein [Bacteriophage sp.]